MSTRQLVDSVIEALRPHAPFDGMEPEALRFLAERVELSYYPSGSEIVAPGTEVSRLFLIKRGEVHGSPAVNGQNVSGVGAVLGVGEGFPIGALIGRRATAYSYLAARDTFCFELGVEDFHALLERSPRFHAFCTRYLANLVDQSHRALRAQARETLAEEGGMLTPLRGLVRRPAESCTPDVPLRRVLERMHELRIGSMVIVDAAGAPVGIFTQPDVLGRVVLGEVPLTTVIGEVMTHSPHCLSAEAPVFEAALAMVTHGIRHIVVVEDGRLAGVVSERDLFSLQRNSLRRISERIRGGSSIESLAVSAGEIRSLARDLLAQGLDAEHLTQIISALNDSLSQRIIAIVATGHALPGRWCWLALGSEGRLEQTLATDQDNALIFSVEGNAEEVRPVFVAFAREVNAGLDACGFPLCRGEIMAGNPRWCLSLTEWRATFQAWIRNPDTQALLDASIFFDFRAIAGDGTLSGELRAWLMAEAGGRESFLRAMAQNALRAKPPLGVFRDFLTDGEDRLAGTLDLKKLGTRPFIDAARILSLAKGVGDTGTAQRLRGASKAGALPEVEADACIEAFHFLQSLRLQVRRTGGDHAGADNRVDPDALNDLDRRILKEAFRQAARLQQHLRLDYGL